MVVEMGPVVLVVSLKVVLVDPILVVSVLVTVVVGRFARFLLHPRGRPRRVRPEAVLSSRTFDPGFSKSYGDCSDRSRAVVSARVVVLLRIDDDDGGDLHGSDGCGDFHGNACVGVCDGVDQDDVTG